MFKHKQLLLTTPDTERKRAELLAARLKELGYDPDTIE